MELSVKRATLRLLIALGRYLLSNRGQRDRRIFEEEVDRAERRANGLAD